MDLLLSLMHEPQFMMMMMIFGLDLNKSIFYGTLKEINHWVSRGLQKKKKVNIFCGISLTIARLTDSLCAVSIIPHTASITTFGDKKTGDEVNIEVDMIGRYVESLLQAGRIRAPDEEAGKSPITESWFKERL